MDEYTRGKLKFAYDNAKISEVATTAPFDIQEMIGRNITSSMTFEVIRDSRNRPWNATKGSVNSIAFEYAGGILGGDQYFNRYLIKSAWWWPFYWESAFMTQARWGYVKQRSGGDLFSYQKFYLGGINTVRGFDYEEISPVVNGNRVGGERMVVFNLEYVFPLVSEQGVMGVVFSDFGNVFRDSDNYTFSDIKKSAGAGIRRKRRTRLCHIGDVWLSIGGLPNLPGAGREVNRGITGQIDSAVGTGNLLDGRRRSALGSDTNRQDQA
jgi:outer membrane protein insertion porin family